MVGRDYELAFLMDCWAQAKAGNGQAVLLAGEAGIGKSCLSRALLDACAGEAHERIHWQCSPDHSDSALWPVMQRLGRSAGLLAHESTESALDKIEILLNGDQQAKVLYAALFGIDGTGRYGPLTMTPEILRERTLELMVEHLLVLARQHPVLLLVEDAHWIDPTTLELIGRCLDRIAAARVLIIIASRPDHQPELGAHPRVTRLTLNRLSRANSQAIVERLGGAVLAASTRTAIVAQSDGVPLVVEEMTKAVLESGERTVPASLHGALMARLDRLPELRELAQIAACIGREFNEALLIAVADRPASETRDALESLMRIELVYRRGSLNESRGRETGAQARTSPRYVFKHVLVQDAAYDSLPSSRREELHVKILAALEAGATPCPPNVLAHHAARGRLPAKAFDYWRLAGEAALKKSAYQEAAAYFGHALRQLEGPQGAGERRDQEVALQLWLGQALVASQGINAPLTMKAYARARDLLGREHDTALHVSAFHGVWSGQHVGGELPASLEAARAYLAAAQADTQDAGRLIAHRAIGMSLAIMGQLVEARHHLEQMLAMHDPERHRDLETLLGIAPRVAPLTYLAATMCLLGLPRGTSALVQQACELGASASKLQTRGMSHFQCSWPLMLCRDVHQVMHHASMLDAIVREHPLPMCEAFATLLTAWLAVQQGRPAEAVDLFDRGFMLYAPTGSRLWVPYFTACEARAQAACGRLHEAHVLMERALADTGITGQRWCEPELWRMRAELFLQGSGKDVAEAERTLERALVLTRAWGSVLLELRSSMTLARLWAEQGEKARAAQLLTGVLDRFTEGQQIADVSEATALLQELK